MSTPLLGADDLRRLGAERAAGGRCPCCGGLVCPGWETLPGGFDSGVLRLVGTLRDPQVDEPTLAEHHPGGTRTWSADAPIAPAFHPYNRSDVLQCMACRRAFLRWTEYGGYYREDRIREIDPRLVADAG
ncbi:MAG TPA: hypothetical protein VFE82_09665 [Ramlibacter sp.]|jgi:hypothetical protein|uniref:hypothetical protein n=1 Tax=Ramlibacter sp. TaxID=1917967 RepID=UPI002D3BF763|nr:hypothetical protein [Ramlibacter sp.]HZY18739.1 hypothetical protein [Ramlibacter sp.]